LQELPETEVLLDFYHARLIANTSRTSDGQLVILLYQNLEIVNPKTIVLMKKKNASKINRHHSHTKLGVFLVKMKDTMCHITNLQSAH